MRERKRLQLERYFSQLKHDIKISNGENAQNWGCKRSAQISRWSNIERVRDRHFLRWVRWSAGKRESFERREKKRNCEAEETSMLLFIARGIYDLLFTLFIYNFIKTNFILFSIKQINKIPFLFSFKSLF